MDDDTSRVQTSSATTDGIGADTESQTGMVIDEYDGVYAPNNLFVFFIY